MLLKRSVRENDATAKRIRRDEEIDELLLQQGVEKERELREKQEEWQRIVEEQDQLYVDLCSDSE